MFRFTSGELARKSPEYKERETSKIEFFRTLDVSVFQNVQDFFRQLGIAFQTDNDKRTITFNLNMDEMHYMQDLQNHTWGVIAFDSDGNKMTVNRVDADKFKALSAKDFPAFSAFQSKSPACSVTEHPAFIKDYSAAHTDIMKRQPAGTYAIMNEEENHYLLVYIYETMKRSVARGIRFIANSDGSIQRGNERYRSINDFLHDGQYVNTTPHEYTIEKHPLNTALVDVLKQNPALQNEVNAYVQTRKNPEILRIVDFLKSLTESTSRYEEEALISAAINLLYLKPDAVCDILECLTRVLPDAACGVIDAPYFTTIGGGDNDASYYRDILLKEMRDAKAQTVEDLMQQLTAIYTQESRSRLRF